MAQCLDDRSSGDRFQMAARLAKSDPVQLDIADHEVAAHQVVERHAACHHVAASFSGLERNLVLARRGFNGFCFDQRQLEVGLGLEERSLLQEVAVSLESGAGDGLHFVHRLRWRFGSRRNVD
jgi:hypothetical protein